MPIPETALMVAPREDATDRREASSRMGKGITSPWFTFVVAAFWVATISSAFSQTPGETCLRKQLDFNPSLQLSASDASEAAMHHSSLARCREFGLRHPDLQRVWESHLTPWSVEFLFQPSENTAQMFETLASDVVSLVSQDLSGGFPLPFQFVFVDLEAPSENESHYNVKELCHQYRTERKVSAFASESTVVICAYANELDSIAWADMRQILLHEAYHAAQFQLLSAPERNESREERLQDWGPEWIVEGSAQYYALRYPLPCSADGISYLRKKTVAYPIGLQELELYWEQTDKNSAIGRDNRDLNYSLSLLATCVLVASSEPVNLHRYFQIIGLGQSWEAAFAEAFGQSISSFYGEFRK